ncbi:MAG TPA: hypothetical protein VNN73_05870 [Blastocatellia bacterium]|nr:hypothetical protein [Blastocatellia bacterium]
MMLQRRKPLLALSLCLALLFTPHSMKVSAAPTTSHRAPALGTDMNFADWPHVLIEGWQDKQKGDEMAAAFHSAGVKTLRFLFGGLYSPRGPEATAAVKKENHRTNEYPWFPLDDFVDFIARHDFTTIVGVNVEEGPDVASDAIQRFIARGLKSRIVAIELSNEPWLNERPWMPEEFGARAADIIERLTPLGIPFALPLTVGKEKNTPTKLSDSEWKRRMLRALAARVDLKNRSDIYGVLHLYARGMRAESVKFFNREVKPIAPQMRYLVTEFNIRLNLEGNPHLTNEYGMEFARKLAGVMAEPDIVAMYTHSVPYHSILYWSNGRRLATVISQRDEKLTDTSRGWHLTPAGRVYSLYSRLAWNGEVIEFRGGDKQSYWAVKSDDGRTVVTLLNDSNKTAKKKVSITGTELNLTAPPRSIVCFDAKGEEIERLTLPY